MNIAQALKEKNRLQTQITTLQGRVTSYNRVESTKGDKPSVPSMVEQIFNSIALLGDLKRRLATASAPVQDAVCRLDQLKAFRKVIQELNCDDTPQATYSKDIPSVT